MPIRKDFKRFYSLKFAQRICFCKNFYENFNAFFGIIVVKFLVSGGVLHKYHQSVVFDKHFGDEALMSFIHQRQKFPRKKRFFKRLIMMCIHQLSNHSWHFFKLFHSVIIALLCLTFLACGNKADPRYPVVDSNGSVIEIKPYKKLDRW